MNKDHNFHALCYDLAQRAGVLPEKRDDGAFFNQQLPKVLVEAADALAVRYDAIIVDEGQDFCDNWWIPLQMLLRDRDDGILYIFFDDNQRLYVRHGAFPIQQPPYLLSVNCRNTQNIHQVVMKFYEAEGAEEAPQARGPLGRPVAVVPYPASQGLQITLQEVLRILSVDQQVPTGEIVVLTSRSLSKRRLLDGSARGGLRLTDTWPTPRGQVYCTTIYDFKGLERAVVILVDIGRWPSEWDDMVPLLYVGCSRARNHLIVLLEQNAPARVRRAFMEAQDRK